MKPLQQCEVSINEIFDCYWCILRFKARTNGCGECVFLNPSVEEEIHIQVPPRLEIRDESKKPAPALRLLKGVHGLKQGRRLWSDAANATLHRVILNLV